MARPQRVQYRPPKRRPYRPDPVRERWYVRAVALASVLALLAGAVGTWAVATNTFGAGDRFESLVARVDRFLAGPVPDRPAPSTILVTEPPATPTPAPTVEPSGSLEPGASATPAPTPTPAPVREAIDVDIVRDPEAVFNSQVEKDWCSPAGVQMVLAQLGLLGTSDGEQREIAGRVREWESYHDSHNGKWGPAAMALALDAYGAPGYEVRAFERAQGRPARRGPGDHGDRCPGHPADLEGRPHLGHDRLQGRRRPDRVPRRPGQGRLHPRSLVSAGLEHLGASDGPGVFQDEDEMIRNFLPWKRPEGAYPDRDGLFIIVAPTIPVD